MKFLELDFVYATVATNRSLQVIRFALSVGLLWGASSDCFAQEVLPAPVFDISPKNTETALDQGDRIVNEELPLDCQPLIEDAPISMATVDISPRDLDGQLVPEEDLPTDCSKYYDVPVIYSPLDLHPATHMGLLRCWPGAQFCHCPIYLEDRCLERCGVSHGCLQPTISAFRFFGGVLLLPLEMCRTPPCSYVSTPACF